MFAHERASSFSCSHASPLSFPSLSLTTSSTLTSQQTLPDQETTAPNQRNEVYGFLAISTPPTSYEPNVTDNPDDMEVTASFFQDSNVTSIYDLGDNGAESPDAEIDDEHVRNALASPRTSRREKQMRACCKLITLMKKACYQVGEPVAWLSQKRKSSQEFAQNSEV